MAIVLSEQRRKHSAMTIVYTASVDLDTPTIQRARAKFEELARAGNNIVIDMRGVSFIDGAGLGALAFLFKRLRVNGHTLRLTNLTGQPRRVLSEMQLMNLLSAPARANSAMPVRELIELPPGAQRQNSPQVAVSF